jgi:putative sigma-54 modulation protein
MPRIVKTKQFDAKPMDPEEAALQMELLGHAFFLFTNTETGHAALLYRRNDGNLGLIQTI